MSEHSTFYTGAGVLKDYSYELVGSGGMVEMVECTKLISVVKLVEWRLL